MEERPRGSEDPQDQEVETSRKKRRGTDFLSQFLLRKREQEGIDAESDDDDEESDEKPKKFRNFFKGLFKNIAEKDEASTERRERDQLFSLDTLFMGYHDEEPEAEQIPESMPESITPVTSEAVAEVVADAPELPEEPADVPPIRRVERAEAPEVIERPVAELPLAPVVAPEERTVIRETEKETTVIRGAGMALPVALVGLEYLARKKADRKIDAKFTDKIQDMEKEAKKKDVVSEQLEKLVKQNKDQIESIKRERGLKTPEKTVIRERAPQRTEVLPISTPERRVPAQLEKAPAATYERQADRQLEQIKTIERITAETDNKVLFERMIERKHEVKDQPSTHVGAASIGSIVASRAKQQGSSGSSLGGSNDQSGLPIINDGAQTEMYKQAVSGGFIVAIVIIAIGIVLYLLK